MAMFVLVTLMPYVSFVAFVVAALLMPTWLCVAFMPVAMPRPSGDDDLSPRLRGCKPDGQQ